MSIKKNIIFGSSMYPYYKNGEIIFVKEPPDNLIVGNCYAFKYEKKIFIHRLFKIKKNEYQFLGDNSDKVHIVKRNNIASEPIIQSHHFTRIIISSINLLFVSNHHITIVKSYFRRKLIRISLTILTWINLYEKKI